MSCVLEAQPMLGAIITTRSLSVKAANPTLTKNKSGKNAYFHFLPLPALFSTSTSEVENLRGNRHHSLFLVKTIIALSGEESQINCWDGEAAIKDERFVRGGVLEKTTHIGGS